MSIKYPEKEKFTFFHSNHQTNCPNHPIRFLQYTIDKQKSIRINVNCQEHLHHHN